MAQKFFQIIPPGTNFEFVLANEGARSLGGLRAGQWVTTGSCTGIVMVAPGTVVVADFPGVGRAEVKFD